MLVKIDHLSLGIWIATAGSQVVIGTYTAVKQKGRALAAYLLGDGLMSIAGMTASAIGTKTLLIQLYVAASVLDDCLTFILILSILNQIRLLGRDDRRSLYYIATFLCASSLVAAKTIDWPKKVLNASPWLATMTIAHTAWSWLAIIVAFIPLYTCFISAIPGWRIMLRFIGIGSYTLARAGLVDVMITKHLHMGNLRYASNLFYFLPLVLWSISLLGSTPSQVSTPASFLMEAEQETA
ncbi:MAG: hypothetical protein HOQ35_04765 [Acidobacteriaceae bacterium]|nr:hypothetical protein [Acidobacteriaceae bacterium]